MSRGHRLFVYGSLLSGEPNHHVLGDARLVGTARTEPRFALVDLGPYPALVEGGMHAIVGEVYLVDDATLATVDRFEGHPDLYRRTPIALDDGSAAETYLFARSPGTGAVVAGGDWRAHRQSRRR